MDNVTAATFATIAAAANKRGRSRISAIKARINPRAEPSNQQPRLPKQGGPNRPKTIANVVAVIENNPSQGTPGVLLMMSRRHKLKSAMPMMIIKRVIIALM